MHQSHLHPFVSILFNLYVYLFLVSFSFRAKCSIPDTSSLNGRIIHLNQSQAQFHCDAGYAFNDGKGVRPVTCCETTDHLWRVEDSLTPIPRCCKCSKDLDESDCVNHCPETCPVNPILARGAELNIPKGNGLGAVAKIKCKPGYKIKVNICCTYLFRDLISKLLNCAGFKANAVDYRY